jgi:hypothetical protein
MDIIKVKLLKSWEELPSKIYDAIELKEGFKLFANTGWWLVDKEDCEIVEEK